MPINDNEALTRTIEHREIFHDEMLALVRRIMGGEMSPVMMAALLVGLRVKKETIGEITAAAQVMREFSTKVEVADRRAPGRHRRHRRRWFAHLQHLDLQHVRGCGLRCTRVQARQPRRVEQVGQCRCTRSHGRHAGAAAGRDRALHRRGGHRLHVRAESPSGDEERRPRAQGTRRAHDLQHPRAADQPGRRPQHPDGRVPSGLGRHPGACAAALWAPNTPWSSTAATAWTKFRSAPRRWSASSRMAPSPSTRSTPKTSA